MGTVSGMAKEELVGVAKPKDPDNQAAEKSVKMKHLGVAMFYGADQVRHGKLLEKLQNKFIRANSDYPDNMTEAYNILVKYKTSYNPPIVLVDNS